MEPGGSGSASVVKDPVDQVDLGTGNFPTMDGPTDQRKRWSVFVSRVAERGLAPEVAIAAA